MKKFSFSAWVLLIALIPFSANALDLVNLKDLPEWFQKSMARENSLSNTSTLKIEQFSVNSKIKGDLELIDYEDGTWSYTVDVDSGTPVECFVFSDFDGPATSLYSIIEYSLGGVETLNNKSVSGRFNYAIDSGMIDGTPYIALDTLYTLGEGKEKVMGILKGIAAKTNDTLQICIHNEPGYRQTFFNVFESFIQAFVKDKPSTNFFEAIYRVSINDIPMGYVREDYEKDSDGDIGIVNSTALMTPVNNNSVARIDTVSTSWSSPDGSIINASEYTLQNGELVNQFSLAYNEDAWHVEGQLQGKAIDTKLAHKEWLLSGYGSYLVLKNLRGSEDESGEYYMWAPSADPTSAIPVVLSKIKDDPTANFKIDMGDLVMKFKADDNAIFRQGVIAHGPMQMDLELMFSKGEPAL